MSRTIPIAQRFASDSEMSAAHSREEAAMVVISEWAAEHAHGQREFLFTIYASLTTSEKDALQMLGIIDQPK